MLGIGITFNPMFDRADALSRAVTLFASRVGTVDFDQRGVINVRTERPFNRLKIRLVTVCGDLNAVRKPRGKIVRECYRSLRATVADAP